MFKGVLVACNLILLHIAVLGQLREPKVSLKKDSSSKDAFTYHVLVSNRSDSILCILLSPRFDLTDGRTKVLAVFESISDMDIFSLRYPAIDTGYAYESIPLVGELILPYQSLSFKIKLLLSDEDLSRFDLEYIYLNDLVYRKFMLEMRKETSWYLNYTKFQKLFALPGQK
jgi:hypothetical protein